MFNHVFAYISATLHTARRDERGATAVEYGLLVALIAAVIIVAVALLGDNITDAFSEVASKVGTAGGS